MIAIHTLEDVLKFLNSIPCIDYGGCGYSAYAIKLWLNKHEPHRKVKMFFTHCSTNDRSYLVNQDYISNKTKEVKACDHAQLTIDGEIYDSEGKHSSFTYPIAVEISDDMMLLALTKASNWNTRFNKAEYVPYIQEKLGIAFNVTTQSKIKYFIHDLMMEFRRFIAWIKN